VKKFISQVEHYPGLHSFFKDRHVFVTGATGFVGGHLAFRLLECGAVVHLLVRKGSNRETVEFFRARGAVIHEGELTDLASIRDGMKGVEFVFHIAALYREAKFADEVYFQVNTEGTKHILDCALEQGVKRVLHCSTIGVHSHIEHPPADETTPYSPTDVYQESKVEAEKLVIKYFKEKGLDGSIIRPAMIWGEGDTRFLKLFKGISRRKLPIIGSGEILTHWIYVHDLVDAFLLAASKPEANKQLYIIAGKRSVTLNEIFKRIAELAKVPLFPFNLPVWPFQLIGSIVETICRPLGIEPPIHRRRADFFIKNRAFNTSKAVRELGFNPRHDCLEEAALIYSWYQQNGWLG
jgi:nucleoside-diphosphate-sugar epimerase